MRLNNRATVRVVVSHDDLSIPLLANPDIYGLSCPCKSPLTLRQIMLGCGTQTCNTTELAFDAYAWEATFTEQCIETCIDLGHDTTDDVCASIALSVMSTFALAQFSSYRPKVQMEQIVLYNYQASFDNGVFNARDSAFMLSLVNETIGKDVNATAYCVMDNPELMIPISVDWTLLDSQFFYACDMDECSWDALETLISVFFATLAIVGTTSNSTRSTSNTGFPKSKWIRLKSLITTTATIATTITHKKKTRSTHNNGYKRTQSWSLSLPPLPSYSPNRGFQ
ncbi:hypothetical protein Pelo_3731 [Pelomyxa schiedti]|nr:hypothetical protein Pelo_3731 [Pelomyxa schiedti]